MGFTGGISMGGCGQEHCLAVSGRLVRWGSAVGLVG